jgi:hypothetical protein
MTELDAMAAQFADAALPFSDPAGAAARASAGPMSMYSHLARMEMHVALAVWHRRIPDYEIAPGSDLTYAGNPRAPHHLTLTW